MVNVRDIVNRPGEMREFDLTIVAPEHLGEGMLQVREGRELFVHVRVESVHEGILASGDVETIAEGHTARTLTEMQQTVEVEFQELFAYSLDEAFDYQVLDDHVDLEPVIRDAVVLSLPFQPELPNEQLDFELGSGINLVLSDSEETTPEVDARWAALAGYQASTDSSAGDTTTDTVKAENGPDQEKS
jgi:uncharacterized protein